MTDYESLRFKRGDAVAIAAVIVAAAVLFVSFLLPQRGKAQVVAQVYKDSELICELPLDTDAEISVDGAYHNVIRVADGAVCIAESDCPGEDCVHSGRQSRAGCSIVCLPNRVEVRLVGAESEDVDAVLR